MKGAEATTLRLLEPSKGCTMLLHYPAGSSQMTRVDSFDDGSDFDSGIRYVDTGLLALWRVLFCLCLYAYTYVIMSMCVVVCIYVSDVFI